MTYTKEKAKKRGNLCLFHVLVAVPAFGCLAGCNWFGSGPAEDGGRDQEEILGDPDGAGDVVQDENGEGSVCHGGTDCEPGWYCVESSGLCSQGLVGEPCDDDADCLPENHCEGTVCDADSFPQGHICDTHSECASTYCVDGYCCSAPCAGDCEGCNVRESEGTCTVRNANDNSEVSATCYYCDGGSTTSAAYSGDDDEGCSDDCTHCVGGSCDAWPSNEQHEGCNALCAACQSGTCGYANSDTYQSGCQACNVCSGSETGSCSKSVTTNWGEGLYGCTQSDQRCYSGSCKDCSDTGGYLYDDGCRGCARQGGNACWRMSGAYPESCDDACDAYGGCVWANWNDDTSCTVCNGLADCTGGCTDVSASNMPSRYVFIGGYGRYRASGDNQDCSEPAQTAGGYGAYYRLCVCQY